MSDLVQNLLTQYYGLNSEITTRKFLSIHKSIENIKNEEVKQVTEQISVTTNKENISEDECQKYTDDDQKTNIKNEKYQRSSRAFNNIEDAYDSDEDSIIYEIDSRENIRCKIHENTESEAEPVEYSKIVSVFVTKEDDLKNANDSDSSLMITEDVFPDNVPNISSIVLKKSLTKREPVCNKMFADFFNTNLKQFPKEILNEFSQLKMLYLGDNDLIELPDEIFTCLKHLKWLDVRNNQISSLPNGIKSHQCIETLLLQANCIKELPLELCTLPKLKTLQVAQNPLIIPSKDIANLGITSILQFLRTEWNKIHPEHRIEFKKCKIEPKLSTILCYQSPRKSKKKIVSPLIQGYNKNSSIKKKYKSYKPSNRYSTDESITLINSCLFKKNLTVLCDSCLQKKVDTKINEKSENTHKQEKTTCLRSINDHRSKINSSIDTKTGQIENKILRLMGSSPRSLYVRQNVKALKTYYKSVQKDCRIKLANNKPEHFIPLKIKKPNSLVENSMKYSSIENIEHCFDIITNDRKRFKLYPMRLSNPNWMLSCLKNYIGIEECESNGANALEECRIFWNSKMRDLLTKQAFILQKSKDENFLKKWRRDRKSFNIAMEKALRRSGDDIPFGFDLDDYNSIFKQEPKLNATTSKGKDKQKFNPPKDFNVTINKLLESLNHLDIKISDAVTPRTKQNILNKDIEKILQFQNEIKMLQKYNDVAAVSLKM